VSTHGNNPSARNWLGYCFVIALVLIAIVGPTLRTMDDDENLGFHAFPDTSLVCRARSTTAAHSAPSVNVAICAPAAINQELGSNNPLSMIHFDIAQQPSPPNLSFPLRS